MTKDQMLKFLEPFDGDIEIFVNLGIDYNNLTIVEPITSAIPISHGYEAEGSKETKEIWLGFEK